MASSNSEKMKAKRWGGGLKMMGRCFNANDPEGPEHDPFTPNLHDHYHQQEKSHQNQHTHHHSAKKALGLPRIVHRTTKLSKQEGEKGQHKSQTNSSPGHDMHMMKGVKELRQGHGYDNVDDFTFDELKYATKHFRPDLILGEGGFGVVYKGVLDEKISPKYVPAILVAIKQLNRNGFQGEREWLTEVNYLGQLSHPNLVKLIGYCCDGEQRSLVYEYMASGCLEKHLFRRSHRTMTWLRRIKVTIDAAKGLAYLHGLEHPIIYRDLKTANVLLDENFNAKLSDFGLAKEGPTGDQTHVSTRVMGTLGYAAPEYMMTGHLTAMSDVYSFGVVLLELLIGRRVLEKGKSNRDHNLVELCRPILNNSKKLPRILDSRLDGQYSIKGMMRVANLAYQCLSSSPKVRPMMRQVVQILETVHEEESGNEDNLFDKKRDEDKKDAEEKTHVVEEERQSRAQRRRREERSRSEPQNDYHLFDQNTIRNTEDIF